MDAVDAVTLVAERARERAPACGATRVIAIDGRSGAGKTAFALDLADQLAAPILHLEQLYAGWHGLAGAASTVRELLADLAVGELGQVRQWDWVNDRPGAWLSVRPTAELIIDGVGSGAGPLRPFLSQLVWLEAPDSVRRTRALARDGQTYEPWWDVWAEQEEAYLAAHRTPEAADLVLATGS